MLIPTPAEEVLLTWQAPVVPRHHRTWRWYLIAGTIIGACAAYGVWTGSYPFAAVAVLIGVVYVLLHRHAPPDRTFALTSVAAHLEKRTLAWAACAGFWFLHTADYTELHLVPTDRRTRELIIQTGNQDIDRIRALLQERVPELTDRRERLLDTFIRICKL